MTLAALKLEAALTEEALAAVAEEWNYEHLNKYLNNPKAAIPGNKMAFAGIPKLDERAALIAWLRSKSDSPKPLP